MGAGWRRVQEGIKQKWNLSSDKSFAATSNERNEMMLFEAAGFANQLKKVEAHVKKMQKEIHAMISDTRNIMLCSLPRTFDFTPSGQAVPEDPDPKLIGQNVQLDRFGSADAILKQRLEEEVIDPLEAWLSAFQDVQARMKKLEALRLELDSRRRTVDNLLAVSERQKIGLSEGGPRLQERHETTLRTMNHKENKKNAVLATFQEHEATTYQALYTLLKDTHCLKDYTGVAYSVLQEVFGTAYTAFETREGYVQGVPSFSSPAPTPNQWHLAPQPPLTAQKSGSGKGFLVTSTSWGEGTTWK